MADLIRPAAAAPIRAKAVRAGPEGAAPVDLADSPPCRRGPSHQCRRLPRAAANPCATCIGQGFCPILVARSRAIAGIASAVALVGVLSPDTATCDRGRWSFVKPVPRRLKAPIPGRDGRPVSPVRVALGSKWRAATGGQASARGP